LALIWLVLERAQIVELCDGQLVEVAEPAHWRRLPEYARPNDKDGMRLGRFRVLARRPDPEHLDHEIYDPTLCKSRGVSLAAWFKREPKTMMRHGVDLKLRQDESGTFVVSGEEYPAMQAPDEAEHFVVAFRRVLGKNAAIVSSGRLLIGVTLVAGLGQLGVRLVTHSSIATR
jgi:hypothetical protein